MSVELNKTDHFYADYLNIDTFLALTHGFIVKQNYV